MPFPSGLLIERIDFPKNILKLKSAEANLQEDIMWERNGLLASVDTFIRINFRESAGCTGETVVEFNHLWTWNDENGQDFVVEFDIDKLQTALGLQIKERN